MGRAAGRRKTMKTPEEIKRGLKICFAECLQSENEKCCAELVTDVIAYIEMLERHADREHDLLEKYGECVDKTVAAKILGVTRCTVYAMLADGRIRAAMGGRRVDVRSIARFMDDEGKRDGA